MLAITANFCAEEFMCPCCKQCLIQNDFVKKLQILRDLVDHPIYINSGYRCEEHNKAVGGFYRSYHLIGVAADINTDGWSAAKLYEFVSHAMILFKGIGIGKTYIHLDTRDDKGKMWVY